MVKFITLKNVRVPSFFMDRRMIENIKQLHGFQTLQLFNNSEAIFPFREKELLADFMLTPEGIFEFILQIG